VNFSDREAWFMAAIEVFRPKFIEAGYPLPERIRVGVGFGPTGGRKESSKILGVTLSRICSADNVNEIWISPEDAEASSMLETLLHELIHVTLDNQDGHSKRFKEIALKLGFTAPMAHTPSSVQLAFELFQLAETLGPYPGAQVSLSGIFAQPGDTGDGTESSGPKKQTTRMLKVICRTNEEEKCFGYTLRMTKTWIEDVGLPMCPLSHEMELEK
jgi:hypothetical protein